MPSNVFETVGDRSFSEKADSKDGTGLHGKNHPLMLRVFTSNQGKQWLTVAHFGGGIQDAKDDTWFHLYYEGLVLWKGDVTLGKWRVVVKGKGLEPICNYIAKGVMETLSPGESQNNQRPIGITSIVIEPLVIKEMEED